MSPRTSRCSPLTQLAARARRPPAPDSEHARHTPSGVRITSALARVRPSLKLLGILAACLLLVATRTASAQHPAAPRPSASAAQAARPPVAEVRLRDSVVLVIRAPHAHKSPAERASDATSALGTATKLAAHEVRVQALGDAYVIYAGEIPILQLYAEDAKAAGDISLPVHAASTAAKLRQALEAEHKRRQLADLVFSVSLVVFLGLITLYVLKRSAAVERRLRISLTERPGKFGAIKVRSFELLGPASARLLLSLLLSVGKWSLWGAAIYGYLVVVSSLFATTRGYADQLTLFIVQPVSALFGRLMASLPVVVLVLLASLVVWILLRLSHLFFSSVSRGETRTEWLPRDMAEALGGLTGVAIVVVAVVFAAPVVTGQPSGAFATVGSHLLLALALGSAPIFASAGLGAVLVLRRHVRLGDQVRIGSASGTIQHFGLVDLVLAGSRGETIRVPYLMTLVTTLTSSSENLLRVVLSVDPNAEHGEALGALREQLKSIDPEATATLLALKPEAAEYELSAPASALDRERLLLLGAQALRTLNIRLSRTGDQPQR